MRFVAWLPAVVVVAFAFGTSIDVLAEAYGAGPPHYGQTTNMDKWSSPLPLVAMLTAIAAGSIALTRWALRSRSIVPL